MSGKDASLGNIFAFTLVVAATAFAAPPQTAHAQSAPAADNAADLEEVSITGSRLRGVAPVGSPLMTIDQESITTSNLTSVDRLIAQTPQVFNYGFSEGSRGQNGGAGNIVYGNGINLRGIGPFATLVLFDGHRAISNGRAFDASQVPSLALQRIEILTDGASAVYGSDAVAGVVNLIPVRNVDGGKLLARNGFADGYDEHQYGVSYGKTWSSGQAFVAYENGYRSRLKGVDRDFFVADQRAFGGRDYRLTQCNPGNITTGTGASLVSYALPAGGATSTAQLVAGTTNRCEVTNGQDLLPRQTYNSVATTFNQKLTDWLEFSGDGFYTQRDFFRQVPVTVSSFTIPVTNAFYVRPPGFAADVAEGGQYLFTELPQNPTYGHARNWEITGGLTASLPADWRAEGLFTYGQNRDLSISTRGLNGTALNAALASSVAATSFDPYGLRRTSAAVLAGISDQLFNAPTNSEFRGYEARFDGPLGELPGGKVRLAAGYERQELAYHAGSQRGGPTTPTTFRNFDRTVNSAYTEVYVPVFGAGNARTGLQKLELNAAVRYDKYSDVGSTTNPKYGFNWSPIDSLTVKGSYGTSLRAPTFAELYGNSNNLFVQNYADPTQNGAIRIGAALSGGNPNLAPEEAKTYTFGFELKPTALPGLRISASYFDIEYTGQIVTLLSDTAILARESTFAGTGIILRDAAATARITELLASGILPQGNIVPTPVLFIDGRGNNLGVSNTRGIDFELGYSWDTSSLGTFNAALSGTRTLHYSVAQTPVQAEVDQLNNIFNPQKLKARANLGWTLAALHGSVTLNYINGYNNSLIVPNEKISSYLPVDLSLSLDILKDSTSFFGNFTIGIDARNVFDTDPPYVNLAPAANGSGGFDATSSDPTGRVIGVSLRKSF